MRVCCLLLFIHVSTFSLLAEDRQSLPGTKMLTVEGDIASRLVEGVDRFLLRKTAESKTLRGHHWNRDFSSIEAYHRSIEPNRRQLAHLLGVRDARVPFDSPQILVTTERSGDVGSSDKIVIRAVRWPVLGHPQPGGANQVSLHAEGLLLIPTAESHPRVNIIAVPDADQTPEQLVGLDPGIAPESQFARRLAESGCRVLVPTLISREVNRRRSAKMTDREFIYRAAYELGRSLIGYELQSILAGVDWFVTDADGDDPRIGVVGYGEGGMLALYAGALDRRIDAICVSGFFGPFESMWSQPMDRNVFGLLKQFGASELATMVAPRTLVIETARGPEVKLPGDGGAPAVLTSPESRQAESVLTSAGNQVARLSELMNRDVSFHFVSPQSEIAFGSNSALKRLLQSLLNNEDQLSQLENDIDLIPGSGEPPRWQIKPDTARQDRLLEAMKRHNELLLHESPFVRAEFMKKLDTSSLQAYEKSVEHYRHIFRHDVIGHFDEKRLPFNARSRKTWETEKWTGYEIVLDVFDDVIAYGVLLLPKDLKSNQPRPVVVCQHGLEGRPTDTFLNDHRAYHDFAAKLCERGFITFAPQNLYIFQDRFRTLQRKANPLGKTLFSIIVPQHQQIVDWLKTQPHVDPDRIAFYGLSYGGKSAMRIPPLVTDYCLSICSADFNEWVVKNASTRHAFSYMGTGEYEIYEFDLGSTFNYTEMAALICPRPFMVERGHFDGVGRDEWVAFEFAKVRHLYAAKLGIGDRTEIEWFVGPHTINGQGTFDFLHRHLDWPKR